MLCREYLALSDDEARRLGPDQFGPAARALLAQKRGNIDKNL